MKLKVLHINILFFSYCIFALMSFGLFLFDKVLFEKYFSSEPSFLFLFFMLLSVLEGILSSMKTELKNNIIILNSFNTKFLLFVMSLPVISIVISFFEEKYNFVFTMFIFSLLFLIRIIYSNLILERDKKNKIIRNNIYNIEFSLNYLKKENSKKLNEKIYKDIEEYLENISKNAS